MASIRFKWESEKFKWPQTDLLTKLETQIRIIYFQPGFLFIFRKGIPNFWTEERDDNLVVGLAHATVDHAPV